MMRMGVPGVERENAAGTRSPTAVTGRGVGPPGKMTMTIIPPGSGPTGGLERGRGDVGRGITRRVRTVREKTMRIS